MDREKLKELIKDSGEIASAVGMQEWVVERIADHLIENGIGDITAEKHRADVAEEALRLACNDVRHNYYMTRTEALIDNYKQQAESD